jgi:hypothetical protein
MLETARTYYKLHGPIANSPYKNADDLTDSSLIERRTSKREITIDAVEAFFASIRDGKSYNMRRLWPMRRSRRFWAVWRISRSEISWDEMLQTA